MKGNAAGSQQANSPMEPLSATALVGVGAIAALTFSVVGAKAYALLVGPSGLGLIALMQSTVTIGLILGSFGLGVTLIRSTASVVASGGRVTDLIRASLLLGVAGGAVVSIIFILSRTHLAEALLGSRNSSDSFFILAPAVIVSIAGTVQIAVLTGLHKVRSVTGVNVMTTATATVTGVSVVAIAKEDGLALAVLLGAAIQFVISGIVLRSAMGQRTARRAVAVVRHAKDLIRAAPSITGSQLASAGSQLVMPIVLLQFVDTADVGLFRAASAVSIGYLTFFLASLTQDYLPRVALASAVDHGVMIEKRMRLVVGLSLPMILGLFAGGPLILELLYSFEFRSASPAFRWLLVGDLVRLPAWVLTFTLMARGQGVSYLSSEIVGGIVMVIALAVGAATVGLTGAGAGYAAAQLFYFGLVWILVRRRVPTRLGRLQIGVLVATLSCATMLVADVEPIAISIACGTAAVASAAVAWPRLYVLHRTGQL